MLDWIAGALAVTFARPAWLAGLPVAIAPAVLAAWGRRRGRRIPAPAIAAQCLALAAVVFAFARPLAAISGRAALPYLLFIDASGSARGQQALAEKLRFPPGAKLERFYFADGLRRSAGAAREPSPQYTAETDIAPVLRMIASRRRDGMAAAVIVTDGHFTRSGWQGPAEAVAAARQHPPDSGGADVLIVPLNAPPPDARIVDLAARRQSPGAVEVSVAVSSNAPVRRTLTVSRTGRAEPLLVKSLALLGETPATIRVGDEVSADAAAEYAARLSGDTVITENDSAAALVLPVRQKVAVVGADAKTRELFKPLRRPVAFLGASELPDARPALAGFSAMVLVDATGKAFSAPQRRALAEYARSGGGLVMIGTGPHERPADRDDPLNRVLPVRANPFRRRPLALRVLLDRSGSMSLTTTAPGRAEQKKFDVAAEAVVALKDHLTPRDTLTVITFADRPKTAYHSGGGPPDFAALRDALRPVRPGGSTKVVPAIDAALKLPALGRRKPMLLVLSDLQTEDFNAVDWAGRIGDAGARLAVVAIGESPPTPAPLEALARLLAERASYERRDDLAGLAKVFAALVRRGRGEAIRREKTAVVVEAPLFDAAVSDLPDLEAYVLAAKHPDAELLARTAGGDPLLARRRAALGRTVGLALPLSASENTPWQASPNAARLLASAVRWTLRGANDPRFDASLHRQGDVLRISATASQDDAPWNGLQLTAAIAAGRIARSARLRQTAPGKYEAVLPCPAQAPAGVAIRDAGGTTVWRGSAAALYAEEFRRLGAHEEALARLARITGGKIVPAERVGPALRRAYRRRLTDLWPWLLAAALLLMLAEWSLTRITRR